MERDAVDGEDVVLEVEIVFEDVADQPGEVVVEDEVDGPAEERQDRPSSITVTASRP